MNKAKYSKRTVLRLMKYIVGIHPFQFACVCVAIIISALANIASPLFLMILVDDYITPMVESGSTDFTAMWQTVALMGAVYLVGVLCTYIYNRLMVNIGQGVQRKIRDDAFTKMQSLPISFFDTHTHGEIMSVYTNDIDTLRQLISQSIPQMFSSFVTAVTTFVVMVLLSWQLSFISIVMIVLMFFVARFFASRSSRNFIAQQKNLGKVNGYIEEIMSGQKVVKVFNHEEEAIDGFKTLNEELCKSATDANRFANVVMPCIANIGNLQFVITAIIGGIAFVSGAWGLTIGALVSYMQFTRSFNHPFALISQQFNSVAMALAGAERIFNLMDQKPEDDDGTVTLANVTENADGTIAETDKHTGLWAWKYVDEQGKTYYRRLAGFVEFRDVSFGYTDDKTILKHISLTALPGQKVAFVGATGAGKTTITNLINRFYDVTQGQIIYDGIDVKKIRKSDLRRSLGIVLQDTVLFTGTVKENIRYGRLDATDEEIYAAAKLANADGFIKRLPDGYDTMLTDNGEGLSQGQRQLISIARAALADCPVLIMDEATSSIDTRTEAMVQAGMDGLMKGRTTFVIAHRLSTIRNSDVIEVMDHGQIIERGAHDELLNNKGIYYALYTGALELD